MDFAFYFREVHISLNVWTGARLNPMPKMNINSSQNVPTSQQGILNRGKLPRFTVNVRIKKDYTNSENKNQLYLEVFLNRKRVRISLGIYVNQKHFSNGNLVSVREKNYDLYNRRINHYVQRAINIYNKYDLSHRELTPEILKRELFNLNQNESFFVFYNSQLISRTGIVAPATIKQQRSTLNKLMAFKQELSFYGLTTEFLFEFEKYLKVTRKNGPNTVATAMKNLRTYCSIAVKKELLNSNPFNDYKVRVVKGNRCFLTKEELKRLRQLYDQPYFPENLKRCLQPFLFACFTGLRISDIYKLERINIYNDILNIRY